jgi:hypothetical protein
MQLDHVLRELKNDSAPSTTSTPTKRFTLFCLPHVPLVVKQVLEDRGVSGNIVVKDFPFDFLPLEQDLFSMEQPLFWPYTLVLGLIVLPIFLLLHLRSR